MFVNQYCNIMIWNIRLLLDTLDILLKKVGLGECIDNNS